MLLKKSARGWVCSLALVAGLGAELSAAPSVGLGELAARESTGVAAAYAIKLTRAVHVGDRYDYVADATLVSSMVANISGRQRTLRPTNVALHFEAIEHILAVNVRGEPSKATYTVRACTKREGKSQTPFLQCGREVTVEAGRWKSRIELDGEPITIRDELVLRAVVSLPSLKDVSLDDAYGSAAPHKAGDSWSANPEALARLVSRQGVKVNQHDVSGTVKLRGTQAGEGGATLLSVYGRANVQHWTPDPADIPKGAKFVDGSDEIKFTKLLPADPNGPCLTDSFSEKATMKVTNADDTISPDVAVDVNVLRTTGIKRTPIGHAGEASAGE